MILCVIKRSIGPSGFKSFFPHFFNKFGEIFKLGKLVTEEIRNKIFVLSQAKFLLSRHLQAAKFEKRFNTSSYMKLFCSEWNCFIESQVWKTQRTAKTRRKTSAARSAKDRFFSDWKMRTEIISFSSDKADSSCTTRRLLARHNLFGRAEAKELMLRAKTRQETVIWCRQRWQFLSRLLEAVCVYGLTQIKLTQRLSRLGLQKSQWKIQPPFYVFILKRSPVPSVLGYNRIRWEDLHYQSTQKMKLAGLYPPFGRSSRLGISVFHGIGIQIGWRQCSISSLPCSKWMEHSLWHPICSVASAQYWLKMLVSVKIKSATEYETWVNWYPWRSLRYLNKTWCPNCTSHCENWLTSEFRTQACQKW